MGRDAVRQGGRVAMGPPCADPLRRLHRYTTLSLVAALALTAVSLAPRVEDVTVRAIFLVGAAVASLLAVWWDRRAPSAIFASGVVLTAPLWAVGALAGEGLTVVPVALVLAFRTPHVRRVIVHVAVLVTALIAVPTVVASADHDGGAFFDIAVIAFLGFGAAYGVVLLNGYAWRLASGIAAAGRAEAELAVLRERVRFASDLHDVQGHSLHVLRMRLATAEVLLERDGRAAADELRAASELVEDSIRIGRSLAFGEREVVLEQEVTNAVNLFDAAAIRCEVDARGTVPPERNRLFGQLVRESATNILRHAQATWVRIEITSDSVLVENDGVCRPAAAPRGLATLGGRFRADGGSFSSGVVDDVFRVRGFVA